MTRKIINIKNILRIIISCFVLVNMVRSCAKAVTYDDIKNYVDATAEMYPNNTKYQWIKDRITSTYFVNGIYRMPIGDYDNFNIKYSQKPTRVELSIWFYNSTEWVTSTSGITFKGQYITASLDGSFFSNSTGAYTNTGHTQINEGQFYSTTANNYNNLYGMNYTKDYIEETYPVPVTYVGNQAAEPPYTYYFGNLHTKEITYSGETVLANTLSYNYRLAPIVNVVCENTIITSMQATLDDLELRCNDLGSYWNLTYNNSTMFKYNQLYNLRVDSIIEGNIKTLEAKILFVPPGTVIENNSIASTPSGDFSFNTENATNQIIDNQNENNNEIIQSINNIVGNLPGLTSGDLSGDSSGDLSSGFDGGGGILGGIFSLFVPDGQFFKEYFEDLNNWFSDRLGLLYFPIELTIDFLTRCLNIDFTQQVLSIGPYVMPLNDNFELVPEIQIDFNSFLEDETVNSIHEVYLFITDGLIIFGLYRLILKKYNNIVKNKGGG